MAMMTYLCIVLVFVCVSTVGTEERNTHISSQSGQITRVYAEKFRWKRATFFEGIKNGLAFIRGAKALKVLTEDAVPLVYSATRQLYRKSGGIKEALKDFDSVRPTNVKVLQTGNGIKKTGTVGNMKIDVQERRDLDTAELSVSNISDNFQQGLKVMTEILYYN